MDLPSRPEDIDAGWLRSALGLPPGVPASVRAERIGEGFGLDGETVRLHLQGAPGLPATLVVKACGAAKGEREARFYGSIAPLLDLALPAFHGRFTDAAGDRCFLVLGDVGPARQGDVLVGLAPDEAEAVAVAAATFHAPFWNRSAGGALDGLPPWSADPAAEASATASRIPVFLDGWGDRIPAAARSFTERLPGALPAARAALGKAPTTLLHTDLHADNILLPAGGPPVILDWPDACRGPAAVDFGHLLVEGMSIEVRRAGEERFAAAWAEEAARRGVADYGPGRLRADADRSMVILWGGIVRWASRMQAAPKGHPRKVPVVENLVRNGAALLADRAGSG